MNEFPIVLVLIVDRLQLSFQYSMQITATY